MIDIYLRSILFGAAGFLGSSLIPILVKWLLIDRWKPRSIRIWSLAPIDGEVREDVRLLGSPSFEIPRSVERDSRFDHLRAAGRQQLLLRRNQLARALVEVAYQFAGRLLHDIPHHGSAD